LPERSGAAATGEPADALDGDAVGVADGACGAACADLSADAFAEILPLFTTTAVAAAGAGGAYPNDDPGTIEIAASATASGS